MLIKGNKLNSQQRAEVLRAYVNRWTIENKDTMRNWRPECLPTIAPVTDEEWLAEHAFHFLKDGSRLMMNRGYAEPHYLADAS